jgi:coenzyme F420-0:L-glutamate ligase/coenzyme F420-1:gamma-L-glutamate ligase
MSGVRLLPIRDIPEVTAGDDLGAILVDAIRATRIDLRDGDVVAVTQKVVSKAEGRLVREHKGGKAEWVARETRRVVARRGELVIAETRHGFVCANAGVDASNVAEGWLTLLPDAPDDSAERLRARLAATFGVRIGVLITDTFGRAWRRGVVNVAIGTAGLPSLVDLRGSKDALGRVLEVTVVARADELAAASGLVMGKAEGVPAVVIRGTRLEDPPVPAAELVRPPEEDLFLESPIQAAIASGQEATFAPGTVPREALTEAALAAGAVASAEGLEWMAVGLDEVSADVLAGLVLAFRGSVGDVTPPLLQASGLIVPCVRPRATAGGGSDDPGQLLLAGGSVVGRLLVALRGAGAAASWWHGSDPSHETIREAVGLDESWTPLGLVGVGPMPRGDTPPAAR